MDPQFIEPYEEYLRELILRDLAVITEGHRGCSYKSFLWLLLAAPCLFNSEESF